MINESDFILNHKKFNNRLDNLYWKNHPGWELQFKKFEDEEFKEVDEYYGFYFISNYGQVVSFHRRLPILRQLRFDQGFFLVNLFVFGVPTVFFIQDLVYTHFCKPLPPGYQVVHRNKVTTDNYYKNLTTRPIVPNRKDRSKTMFDFSLFYQIESESPGISASAVPVLQFDKNGKFIKEYPSLMSPTRIHLGCTLRNILAGEYQWRYKRDPLFKNGIRDIEPVIRTYPNSIPVLQFDLNGKFIKEYPTLSQAVQGLKTNDKTVYKCAAGEKRKAGGFQWRFKKDPAFANGITDIEPLAYPGLDHLEPVLQFDKNGKFLKEYPSRETAAKQLNIRQVMIRLCCKRTYKLASGYQWRYKSDPLFSKGIRDIEPVKYKPRPNISPVLQFDLQGNFIREYQTKTEAEKYTGIKRDNIKTCASKAGNYIAGGFQWRYKNDPVFKDGIKNIGPACKPVYFKQNKKNILKFDLQGNFVKEYESVFQAAREIGAGHKSIRHCAKGKAKTAHNFQWRFASDPLFAKGITNIGPAYTPKGIEKKPVLQFSAKGKFLKQYPSIDQAAKTVGVTTDAISKCLNGLARLTAGYQWRYKDEPTFKNGNCDIAPAKLEGNFSKPVLQFDLEGNYLAEFPTAARASKMTGIASRQIRQCLDGRLRSSGGYQFRFKDDPRFKNGIVNIERTDGVVRKKINGILQFDLKGKFLQRYESVKEAARAVGRGTSTLTYGLQGNNRTVGGYQWRYADDPAFKNGITRLEEVKPTTPLNAKTVVQYDPNGNIIRKYNSVNEASRETGIRTERIRQCAKGKIKETNGFTWKYENQAREKERS
jgi:hypothetical protein